MHSILTTFLVDDVNSFNILQPNNYSTRRTLNSVLVPATAPRIQLQYISAHLRDLVACRVPGNGALLDRFGGSETRQFPPSTKIAFGPWLFHLCIPATNLQWLPHLLRPSTLDTLPVLPAYTIRVRPVLSHDLEVDQGILTTEIPARTRSIFPWIVLAVRSSVGMD